MKREREGGWKREREKCIELLWTMPTLKYCWLDSKLEKAIINNYTCVEQIVSVFGKKED